MFMLFCACVTRVLQMCEVWLLYVCVSCSCSCLSSFYADRGGLLLCYVKLGFTRLLHHSRPFCRHAHTPHTHIHTHGCMNGDTHMRTEKHLHICFSAPITNNSWNRPRWRASPGRVDAVFGVSRL